MDKNLHSLYEAILQLQTTEECEAFFKDICTPKEIKDLQDRWRTAQLLAAKELSYREIQKLTGVSLATITRVARFLSYETYCGYKLVIDRLRDNGE
ncbi:Trp operon repressor, partial [Candidatus Arcanobacter lacustris]|jgi:TrpR-related protein YerC/YecD